MKRFFPVQLVAFTCSCNKAEPPRYIGPKDRRVLSEEMIALGKTHPNRAFKEALAGTTELQVVGWDPDRKCTCFSIFLKRKKIETPQDENP
jgi:hypothetical protein